MGNAWCLRDVHRCSIQRLFTLSKHLCTARQWNSLISFPYFMFLLVHTFCGAFFSLVVRHTYTKLATMLSDHRSLYLPYHSIVDFIRRYPPNNTKPRPMCAEDASKRIVYELICTSHPIIKCMFVRVIVHRRSVNSLSLRCARACCASISRH